MNIIQRLLDLRITAKNIRVNIFIAYFPFLRFVVRNK